MTDYTYTLADLVKDILEREILGLSCTARVRWDRPGAPLELVGVYACPCGEESMLRQLWDWSTLERVGMPMHERARLEADELKRALREHVIGEGNTPGF